MSLISESIAFYFVKVFGSFIRLLPESWAVGLGRGIGLLAYYLDIRHKALSYGNLKMALAQTHSLDELKQINKNLFRNYGQNIIELLRLPKLSPENIQSKVRIEGIEHIEKARSKGKGAIMLAMHFGSWEMASAASAMQGIPYKFFVKPQKRFSRLDNLLNSYRRTGGSVLIMRGSGTREFVKALHNNEVVGMVVDQGGRDGILVPFFGRDASMSVGAIRMGLKTGVPLCFSIIVRDGKKGHRLIVHPPIELENTGDVEKDVQTNLKKVTNLMEEYIRKYPSDYMWFYKIWKYSHQNTALILDDGRMGHLRQSQTVSLLLSRALQERGISLTEETVSIEYRSKLAYRILSMISLVVNPYISQGRLSLLSMVIKEGAFEALAAIKPDFIISCGSSTAAINYLLAVDQFAKSIVVQKPGLVDMRRFDLAILPEHDWHKKTAAPEYICLTKGTPNMMSREYMDYHEQELVKKFTHLRKVGRVRIGLLMGGDTREYHMKTSAMRQVIHQVMESAMELNAEILATTSRRTPSAVENVMLRELKKHPACNLLIVANKENHSSAIGGILSLCDIVVVSGDSISMISEAASSGKKIIVFPVFDDQKHQNRHKHNRFIDHLNKQGFIVSASAGGIRKTILNVIKNKLQIRTLNDREKMNEYIRLVI